MKATVDKETCIGCGLCESICPAVFKLGSDGKSDVIVDEISKNLQADCQQAADSCPVSAITIFK
jgi:ferredoxin